MKMDPIMGRVGDRGDVRIQSMHLPKKKNKLFGGGGSLFPGQKHKLFT